jgi:hypothetical protein
MRLLIASLAGFVIGLAAEAAHADKYKWCAQYSGRGGGSSNCYFETLAQCQMAVSGVGGFCRPSNFGGPEQRPRRTKRRVYD